MKFKKLLLPLLSLSLFAGLSGQVSAQIVIDNTQTPEWYVQNVLLGQGVTVSNITFNGGSAQTVTEYVGSFDGQNSNIGLNGGLMLATGDVSMAVGPNNNGGMTLGGGNFGQSDPDLDAIVGGAGTNDAAVLEFDFIPSGDSLRFRYVFSSEEYLEWVNGGFNDAFGFFLSGPGINGPYTNNAENIALIPGTTTPVSIDNVNDVSNSAYYVDNGDGASPPQNTDVTVVQYDGFTVVLEALAIVQCGQQYHIKLAIADAGDASLDSGVFLEEGSFASNSIEVNVTTVTGDSSLVEGCFDATFSFVRPDTVGDLWITIDLGGNAIEGVDFASVPDSLLIPSGQDSTLLTIDPFADGIPEGTDTLIVTVFTVNICGDTIANSATLFIVDTLIINSVAPDITIVCPQDSVTFSATASGAVSPYYYDWSTGDNGPFVTVGTPATTTEYYVTITDSCQNYSTVDTVIVTINIPPDPVTTISPDTAICPGESATLVGNTVDGSDPITYNWSSGQNTATITVTPPATATYFLTGTDQCGRTSTDSVTVTVFTGSPLIINAPEDFTICDDDSAFLAPTVSGGFGPVTVTWAGNGVFTPISGGSAQVLPAEEGLYTFTATGVDMCGNMASDDVIIDREACSVEIPNVFSPNGDGLNDFFTIYNIDKFPNNTVEVYNRWGKLVFEETGYNNTWKGTSKGGKDLSDGTYYYIVILNSQKEPMRGHVTITRNK